MSTQQTADGIAEQNDEQTDEQADEQTRHPRYEETTISAYSSNAKARNAFNSWEIKPSRTTMRSELRKSFDRPAYYHYGSSLHCYQFPSGLGFTEANTGGGLYSAGRMAGSRCRLPDGSNLSGLNIDQVYDFLEAVGGPNIAQLRAQYGAENSRGGFDSRENFVLEFEDGEYAVILYDGSANRRSSSSATRAGMLVEQDDEAYARVERLLERDEYSALSDLVAPDEVLASELDVITSSEYRNRSGRANAGGYGHEDSVGDDIIRQGEWYFIPQPDLDFPDADIEKPLSEYEDETALGSHVPRDQVVIPKPENNVQKTIRDDMDLESGIYVRGTVRHQRNEHSMFHLYDVWHKVVENTRDMYAFETSGSGRVE